MGTGELRATNAMTAADLRPLGTAVALIFLFSGSAVAAPGDRPADVPLSREGKDVRVEVLPAVPPWKKKLDLLAARRSALSANLSQLHSRLRALTAQRPDLLARLEKEAPKAAKPGYGVLSPIEADEPDLTVASPVEKSYSMAELGQWLEKEQSLLAELDARLELRSTPLEKEIDFYNKRAETFRTLDVHFSYHSFWQDQVLKWPQFWDRKNQLLALYRSWRTPLPGGTGTPDVRGKLEREMLRIAPGAALCLKPAPSGWSTLPVRIATDITDEAFLAAFSDAVERHWNDVQAMKEARLRISLAWDRVSPETLYPEGPPQQGERIDPAQHRKRFGQAPLVLTTGADSTHVLGGGIFLGADPVTPGVLAHEFAHVIGFEDAYIRAYDGSAADPHGVVFREVTPFPDSLMATPRRGKVTPRMVEVLRESYRNCD